MKTPAIQNDFSYYRRMVNGQRMGSLRADRELLPRVPDVSSELAIRMSLFFANATPMLRVLSDATSKFVQEVIVQQKTVYKQQIQQNLLSGPRST